jgi:hypothetical protein
LYGQAQLDPNREANDLTKAETVVKIQALQRGTGMGAIFVEPPPIDIGTARRRKNLMTFVPGRSR